MSSRADFGGSFVRANLIHSSLVWCWTRLLAELLILAGAVPPTEPEDAMHIAIATVEQMDFVATLNFAHFASPSAKFRLQLAISELGYRPPLLASPDELLESENDE